MHIFNLKLDALFRNNKLYVSKDILHIFRIKIYVTSIIV